MATNQELLTQLAQNNAQAKKMLEGKIEAAEALVVTLESHLAQAKEDLAKTKEQYAKRYGTPTAPAAGTQYQLQPASDANPTGSGAQKTFWDRQWVRDATFRGQKTEEAAA